MSEGAREPWSETEKSSDEGLQQHDREDTHVLSLLYKGNVAERNRQEQREKNTAQHLGKHNFDKNTRCTTIAQEECSALPAGVFNVNEDSDDADAYDGEQKEIAKEMDELRAAESWVNQEGWDADGEARAYSSTAAKEVPLRLEWDEVRKKIAEGAEPAVDVAIAHVDRDAVLSDYALDKLDPTQRAFAERMMQWAREVVRVYQLVRATGEYHRTPRVRTWLGGSAGSGKSTTLRTVLQHCRLLFQEENVPATIELTAYTGVAAFNIGFGAKTAVSSFQIFPGATWKAELAGDAARKLEHQWANVELLIVDEVSFIGRAFFTRMHFRLQQGKRRTFSEWALDPNEFTFGDLSIILVGDFGQLEPIDDWSMCDRESRACDQPKLLLHLWKHAQFGKELLK